jgi:hypothetical protein
MDIADETESCPAPPPTRFSYKGDPPWDTPPVVEVDATVFHTDSTSNSPPPPKIRHFIGTINLDFAIVESKRNDMNVALLLKRFVSFAKQTEPDFRIDPFNSLQPQQHPNLQGWYGALLLTQSSHRWNLRKK